MQLPCHFFCVILTLMDHRIVMHVDMDAFFASVEVVNNPSLKGKPVIVGGDPDKRGVVSTCSYEARKFGVRSAMSMFEAKKRCPHAIFLEGNFALYREASDKVMEILQSFSPCVEIVGIDEAYVELKEDKSSPFKVGQSIRRKVFEATSLTCSVGIGSNKLIAKIASSHAKPNGLFEVPPNLEKDFLAPLPIESIPGIGIRTQVELNNDGIFKVSDLQNLGMDTLINRYGAYGYYFHLASHGKDNRPVSEEDPAPKSIGAETTFEKDIDERDLLLEELQPLIEKAYQRMRRHKMRTRGVSLKLRFSDFKTITRSLSFENHTINYRFLKETTCEFFTQIWPGTPLRLIGLSFEKLTDSYWQPTFWDWLAEQNQET